MKGIISIALFIFCLVGCTRESNVTLQNNSNSEISKAIIEVCNQKFVVSNLKSGNSQNFVFVAKFDSHYSVKVDFANGRQLNKELGYVTNGMTFNDLLVVDHNDIVLKSDFK